MCCNETNGACETCDSALAYVTSWVYDSWETGIIYQSTWMRLCPGLLAATEDLDAIGMVIFHEAVHMISAVSDLEGGYVKKGMVEMASERPSDARNNADSYTMYVAQNGMSVHDYSVFTNSWWGNNYVRSGCSDKYGNFCHEQGVACCDFEEKIPNQGVLGEICCASCTLYAETEFCKTGAGDQCVDRYGNCADADITGEGSCGDKIWSNLERYDEGCCQTCRQREE
jgi:hypothetical protein